MLRVLKFSFLLFISCAFADSETKAFTPFTGKILGYKVRMRNKPDLDSYIIKQLSKNDLVLIVGEENDFWKVSPPKDCCAYIFRSYVIDDIVEANRVNVRLKPTTDSPIISQVQKGEKIVGTISKEDHRWLEIGSPERTTFYIAKELVGYAGDQAHIITMNRKKDEVKELLNNAYLLTEKECKKSFDQMTPETAISLFEKIIEEYPEFDEFVQQSKDGLSLLQDSYLQKKIAYLEVKANILTKEKKHIASATITPELLKKDPVSIKMKNWKEVEKSLYQKWSIFHSDKSLDDFYKEQRVNSLKIKGIVKRFNQNIKNKPGDYIIEGKSAPIGYLYSTMVNLEKYEGKEVTFYVSPRSNHHFAFPAYFVIESSSK